MNNDLALRRRFYADEIAATSNLTTQALVEALATVPRERFLPSGPWVVRAEGDYGGPPRQTADANPEHVYHNFSVAIDAERQLFNGGPGIVSMAIDALALREGHQVLHIGCGLGYYSALMAHVVGSTGRVVAIEVDEALAQDATQNLSMFSWVDVRHSNGTAACGPSFDAVLVSTGVTHPRDTWLDALESGGRLALPLTAAMPKMGRISKGPMLLLTKGDEQNFGVRRIVPLVSVYSALDLRDESLNEALGNAFMRAPFAIPKRLRRDAHDPGPTCWLHAAQFCFASQ
jgi:protein-L-isoaspartate(D-aspartate) O-methyltransferase